MRGEFSEFVFSAHSRERMLSWGFSRDEVKKVVRHGEAIESYPDDTPYPSRLHLSWIGDRPVHVVSAVNEEQRELIIITVYEPSPELWDSEFKNRKIQE